MRLRVAPYYASIGCVGDRVPGLPQVPALRLSPAMDHRGDSISRILQRCGSRRCGLPRLTASPAAPPTQVSGFPSSSAFRLYRRWSLEATRGSHPSAVPINRFRVAPYYDASVSPTISSRVPRNLHLPAPADEFPRLPRFFHPPASPERIFGSPRIFFDLWLLRLTSFQFALALRSFGGAEVPLSGSPRIADLQLCRSGFLRFPLGCFHGWVDDEP